AAAAARHALRGIRHPKAAEKLAQSGRDIIITSETICLRAAIDLYADRDNGRVPPLQHGGKSDRRLQLIGTVREVMGKGRRIAGAKLETGGGHEGADTESGNRRCQQHCAAEGKLAVLIFWSGSNARIHLEISIGIRMARFALCRT